MADLGHDGVDKLLKELEAKMDIVYGRAVYETKKKLKKQLADYEQKLEKKKDDYLKGKLSAADFDKWKKNQAAILSNTKSLVYTLTDDYLNTDEIATDLINGHTPEAYALNYNYATYGIEEQTNINTSFVLYDHATVENLIMNEPELLPRPKIDIPKDKAWNKKHIVSAITQGVLQGESIPEIAARLAGVVDMDRKAAVRNARTAMTGAQNAGRLGSYKRAKKKGVGLQKKWVATLDNRTRHTHRMLDGETIDLEDKFSNDLMNPGDPHGKPWEVYNCRCTMVSSIEGFPISDDWKYSSDINGITYDEWKGRYAYANPTVKKEFGRLPLGDVVDKVKEKNQDGKKALYNILGSDPNGVWKKYLTGKLEKNTVKKIDDFLSDYVAEKINVRQIFADKKMSHVYDGLKVLDVTDANKFYFKLLKPMGKPSQVWNDFLSGSLSAGDTKKIESFLLKYVDNIDDAIGEAKVKSAAKKAAKKTVKWEEVMADWKGVDLYDVDINLEQFQYITDTAYSKGFLDAQDYWNEYKAGKIKDEKLNELLGIDKKLSINPKPVKKTMSWDEAIADWKNVSIYDVDISEEHFNHVFETSFAKGFDTSDEYWEAYKAGKIKDEKLNKILGIDKKLSKKPAKKVSLADKAKAASSDVDVNKWVSKVKHAPSVGEMLEKENTIWKMPEAARDAFDVYSGNSFRSMNGYIRELSRGATEAAAKAKSGITKRELESVKELNKAFDNLRLDKTYYLRRGTDMGDVAGAFMSGNFFKNKGELERILYEEEDGIGKINGMFSGKVGNMASFTSTSSQWDRGFYGDLEVVFEAPKGTRGCSIMNISQYGTDEGETLLGSNTKVKFIKIEKSDGHMGSKYRAYFKIIPD